LTASDWNAGILLPESVTASAPAMDKKKAAAAKTIVTFGFIFKVPKLVGILNINEATPLTNIKHRPAP
jgi:hypothetical protein